jgi:CBS domain-containing protein
MRTVKDILEGKPRATNTISSKALVIDALKMLISVNLSYLVVMDEGEYVGIFSERDYSRNVVLNGLSSRTATVGQVMNVDLPEVLMSDSIETCMNLMAQNKARYLKAINGNSFKGIVTVHDILRQILANKEEVFDDSLAHQLIDAEEGSRIY